MTLVIISEKLKTANMPSSLNIESCYDDAMRHNSRGSSLDKSESSAESSAGSSSAGSSNGNMKISDKVEEELSQLWDSGQEWILIFDNLLKHPGGKIGKGCKCDMCLMQKPNRCHSNAIEGALENSGKQLLL